MIPRYLRSIARELPVKKGWQQLRLVCACGCETFHIFRNKPTPEEKAQSDAWRAEHERVYQGSYAMSCTRNPDGTLRHWKHVFPGIKVEVFPPEPPKFMGTESWFVRCAACGAEHSLFDNRFHGYEGFWCPEMFDRDYEPYYAQRRFRDGKPRSIELKLEYEESLEAFEESIGETSDMDTFADSFTWITAYALDDSGKRTKLFDCETA